MLSGHDLQLLGQIVDPQSILLDLALLCLARAPLVLHLRLQLAVIVGQVKSVLLLDRLSDVFELVKVSFVFHEARILRHDLFAHDPLGFLQLTLLLLDRLHCLHFLLEVSGCALGLFNQTQHLGGAHLDDLNNAALHNQKVRVVHVQFDA